MGFHNTTHETGPTLATYRQSAMKQEEAVLQVFRNSKVSLSPSEVWRLMDTRAPLTSIRRSISDLTKAGLLVKTDWCVTGVFGRNEGVWRLGGGQ